MKTVKFLSACGPYNADELASFPPEQADKLVKAKVAEETEQPKPVKKSKAEDPPKETF